MNLNSFTHIYFLGIGGIGMSALARYFNMRGWVIGGYDKTPSPLTDHLSEEGMQISFNEQLGALPKEFRNIEKTLVVYTPAVPADHPQLVYFRENDFNLFKRARILAEIANHGKCLAVAGTHGKTTTSSMLTHILRACGIDATGFMGGIANNFNSNFVIGKAQEVVVEADEFDRSFLQLEPELGIITNMDADHLDIYGDDREIKAAFNEFADKVKSKGQLVAHHSLNIEDAIPYGIDTDTPYAAKNVRIENGYYVFDLYFPQETIRNVHAGVGGQHNIENAIAAAALAHISGAGINEIAEAISSFAGVQRRFDVKVRNEQHVYIDDYAHHPTELKAIITAVKTLFPDEEITGVFQPHLFTRTRDFLPEFAESLSMLDHCILMDIYPARELPLPGITSERLLEKIQNKDAILLSREGVIDEIRARKPRILLTLGAGDIDRLVPTLTQLLSQA